LKNGEEISYQSIASDCGVSPNSIKNYIEIKSATSIQGKHLKGIRALKEEGIIPNFAVVSCDRYERKTQDDITIFPWELFLEKLWKGDII